MGADVFLSPLTWFRPSGRVFPFLPFNHFVPFLFLLLRLFVPDFCHFIMSFTREILFKQFILRSFSNIFPSSSIFQLFKSVNVRFIILNFTFFFVCLSFFNIIFYFCLHETTSLILLINL